MRILYGVQATGNGHITRARVMAPALAAEGVEVDYLFSGRPESQLFNMEPFGRFLHREGLTFVQRGGKVDLWDTVRSNSIRRCWRDAGMLDLTAYDCVVSDFEPVTAWAARRQKVPSIGIAHQYALCYPVPGINHHLMRRLIHLFAPVDKALGVHWHHFDSPVLPPLIQAPLYPPSRVADTILVYLPALAQEDVTKWLRPFEDCRFLVYCAVDEERQCQNIHLKPFSRDGFQRDLSSCAGVITHCGFGLISEALQYGKKVLSLPISGQVEQQSNAQVLRQLGLGTVADPFDDEALSGWLLKPPPAPVAYPDVARVLARWIASGTDTPVQLLADELWASMSTTVPSHPF